MKIEYAIILTIAILGVVAYNAIVTNEGSINQIVLNTVPSTFEKDLELRVHELVNEARIDHGLEPLAYNDILSDIARLHSEDMGRRGFFEHESPEGNNFVDRYKNAGFRCSSIMGNAVFNGGENLVQIEHKVIIPFFNVEQFADSIVSGWLESEGHRENILRSEFIAEGIGIELTFNKIIGTQNFC